MILFDTDGQRLMNASHPERLGMSADPPSLQASLATGRPTVGPISQGVWEHAIPVRAPVLRDGKVTAVVTIAERPQGFSKILSQAQLPKDWIVTVIDAAGRVVARSRNEASFVGRPASANALAARKRSPSGTYDGVTLEHVDTISAFWTSPAYGWSVHVGIPRSSFEAPLKRQLALTGAGFAFSLLLAAVFAGLLLHDLRARRREADAIEQSERMEALGRLTGGVAHDFNNLLMIIQGNAEILQRRALAETLQRPLAAIREATARATRLTRELLVFARGGQAEPQVLDLNATLGAFLGAIRQAIGSGIELKTDFEAGDLLVAIDRVQLELAVLNLAINARDAMPDGGLLTLATRRPAPDLVQLSVMDTGHGMSEAVRARVFDPFFTTKPQGAGTGLGLTQVYGLVRHAGGSIEVQSKPGRGAAIILRLPAAQRPPTELAPAPAEQPAEPGFDGLKILVVDDNAAVRELTAAYLRERGAAVVECDSGGEGVRALEAGGFAAVVSDIVMTGEVDGLALAEIARERWPGLRTLLVSGYSVSLTEAGQRGFRVLRKPYDLDELSRALAALLDGAPHVV